MIWRISIQNISFSIQKYADHITFHPNTKPSYYATNLFDLNDLQK